MGAQSRQVLERLQEGLLNDIVGVECPDAKRPDDRERLALVPRDQRLEGRWIIPEGPTDESRVRSEGGGDGHRVSAFHGFSWITPF